MPKTTLAKEWRAWVDWQRIGAPRISPRMMDYESWLQYGPYDYPKSYVTTNWAEND